MMKNVSPKRRRFFQCSAVLLPLALLLLFQFFSSNDLDMRIARATNAHTLALQASQSYKKFLADANDAEQSEKLSIAATQSVIEALQKAKSLGAPQVGENIVAAIDSLERIKAVVLADHTLESLQSLKVDMYAADTSLATVIDQIAVRLSSL